MTRPLIAVQLYTLRDKTQTDMIGTLRQLKEIGYEGVEFAGYGDAAPEEVVSVLQETGLKAVASHIALNTLESELSRVIDEAKALQSQYVVCPFVGPNRRGTLENYKQLAHDLNDIGAKLKDAGLQLCYHNHAFEFEERFDLSGTEGTFGLDVIYQESDSELVQCELDTFWVRKGGVDPASYLRKYSGRVPLVHLKDMTNDEAQTFAPVGTGIMDFQSIFAASEEGGAVAYIVEQDKCAGDSMDAVRTSFENLKQMGKA